MVAVVAVAVVVAVVVDVVAGVVHEWRVVAVVAVVEAGAPMEAVLEVILTTPSKTAITIRATMIALLLRLTRILARRATVTVTTCSRSLHHHRKVSTLLMTLLVVA